MAKIKPMYKGIFHFCRVPQNDAIKIIDSIDSYEAGNKNAINKAPKMIFKRSYMAWALVFVYFDSPFLIWLFIFTFGFYIPFSFIHTLFSLG